MNDNTTLQTMEKDIDSYILEEKEIASVPSQYESVFTVTGTETHYMNMKRASGLGLMQAVTDLQNAPRDTIKDGYIERFDMQNYRLATEFSNNTIKGDENNIVEDMARDIMRVPMYSRNLRAFSLFRNAFNSLYTFGNGKPLISVAHPEKNISDTWCNTFADGYQLSPSEEAVKLLDTQFYRMKTGSNNKLAIGRKGKKKILFGTQSNKYELYKIAGDEVKTQPDTLYTNAPYIQERENYDVMIMDWIDWDSAYQAGEAGSITRSSDSNYWDKMWGIFDLEEAKKNLKFYYRTGYFYTDKEKNKANEALIYYVYDMFMYGIVSQKFIVMSKGDNSLYTG